MSKIVILYGLYLMTPNGAAEERNLIYGYPGSNYAYGMDRDTCVEIRDKMNDARIEGATGSMFSFECIPKYIEKKEQ